MTEASIVEGKAAELRRAFDRSFASPPPPAPLEFEDLLAIRVAGDGYAIRLREISGVVAGRTIVAVPAAHGDLLGLVGIRGAVVPVFGLASLLGYGPPPAPPRWMVLCGAQEALALALSDLEGHLRLPTSSLQAARRLPTTGHFVDQVASTAAGARAVLSIPLIVAALRNRSDGRQRSSDP